jgi:hypothetical protein
MLEQRFAGTLPLTVVVSSQDWPAGLLYMPWCGREPKLSILTGGTVSDYRNSGPKTLTRLRMTTIPARSNTNP